MTKQLQGKPIISQYLERYKGQIEAALPKHMTADRMTRIVLTEIRKIPKLAQCNPVSLFGAIVQASQLGLEPGSALGHCYLIPFKKEVQLIIGYRGLIDLARRSGQIQSIEAREVYSGDEFSYEFGLNPNLTHRPAIESDRGEITHFYSIARLIGGGVQWEVLTAAEVNKIRDESQGYKNGVRYKNDTPWITHYSEMGKKTVIRRLFKYLPISIEIQTAIALDTKADTNEPQYNSSIIDGEFIDLEGSEDKKEKKDQTRTDAVKSAINTVDTETGEVIEG